PASPARRSGSDHGRSSSGIHSALATTLKREDARRQFESDARAAVRGRAEPAVSGSAPAGTLRHGAFSSGRSPAAVDALAPTRRAGASASASAGTPGSDAFSSDQSPPPAL